MRRAAPVPLCCGSFCPVDGTHGVQYKPSLACWEQPLGRLRNIETAHRNGTFPPQLAICSLAAESSS